MAVIYPRVRIWRTLAQKLVRSVAAPLHFLAYWSAVDLQVVGRRGRVPAPTSRWAGVEWAADLQVGVATSSGSRHAYCLLRRSAPPFPMHQGLDEGAAVLDPGPDGFPTSSSLLETQRRP